MPAEEPTGLAGPVVLRLTLDGGEPISGIVERIGSGGKHTFNGWVDLISAIETLSDRPSTDRHEVPDGHHRGLTIKS